MKKVKKVKKVKEIVKDSYARIAISQCGCCGGGSQAISKSIGYKDEDLSAVPDANLGLGCGNPVAISSLKEGDIVLDLGSGAGFDAFLAAKKVGPKGRVIGVDMTGEMIDKAKTNAKKYNYTNVEFKLADIEDLPLENDSIDVIISNCVINLSPDKASVFKEAYRVLKPGGKIYISDIVLLEELSEEIKNNEELIAACVGGAILKDEYLKEVSRAGFSVKIIGEDKEISKRQYQGIALESISIEALK